MTDAKNVRALSGAQPGSHHAENGGAAHYATTNQVVSTGRIPREDSQEETFQERIKRITTRVTAEATLHNDSKTRDIIIKNADSDVESAVAAERARLARGRSNVDGKQNTVREEIDFLKAERVMMDFDSKQALAAKDKKIVTLAIQSLNNRPTLENFGVDIEAHIQVFLVCVDPYTKKIFTETNGHTILKAFALRNSEFGNGASLCQRISNMLALFLYHPYGRYGYQDIYNNIKEQCGSDSNADNGEHFIIGIYNIHGYFPGYMDYIVLIYAIQAVKEALQDTLDKFDGAQTYTPEHSRYTYFVEGILEKLHPQESSLYGCRDQSVLVNPAGQPINRAEYVARGAAATAAIIGAGALLYHATREKGPISP